ncbi:TPA: pheA operon leader peptide PheL [Escherichia coli]|nr:pheA operon leader peptide PheL [Escherichia coli]MEB2480651.1 pheA operon leader peptide PheL [Escherichia coli]HBG9514904.1 pheA operon leader peptide PheL [Escherichia coli]
MQHIPFFFAFFFTFP